MKLNFTSIVLASLGASCLVLSGYFFVQEIAEVNRKLPEDKQISYWWMYMDKYTRIRDEYKHLYPRGRIHMFYNVFQIVGFALLLLALFAAGAFKF